MYQVKIEILNRVHVQFMERIANQICAPASDQAMSGTMPGMIIVNQIARQIIQERENHGQ